MLCGAFQESIHDALAAAPQFRHRDIIQLSSMCSHALDVGDRFAAGLPAWQKDFWELYTTALGPQTPTRKMPKSATKLA